MESNLPKRKRTLPTTNNSTVSPEKSAQPSSQGTNEEVRAELQKVINGLQQDLNNCHEQLNIARLLLEVMNRSDADWQTVKAVLAKRNGSRPVQEKKIHTSSENGEMKVPESIPAQPNIRQQAGQTAQYRATMNVADHVMNKSQTAASNNSRPSASQSARPHIQQPLHSTAQQAPSKTVNKRASVGNRTAEHTPIRQSTAHMKEAGSNNKQYTVHREKIKDIIFYAVLAVIVAVFLIMTLGGGSGVRTFLGHSMLIVKSGSMEDVYPKGSLIITRRVDADSLEVGDDITFMTGTNSTITHRIVSVLEAHGSTGERGFRTQGIMNQSPDAEIVSASNVVGKVVFVSEPLGHLFVFISNNWPILLFGTIIVALMITVIRRILLIPDGDDEDNDIRKPVPRKRRKPRNQFMRR